MLKYVELDNTGTPTKTKCMKCGDVIASLKDGKFKSWSHYKAYPVEMKDGSIASLPTCKDCFNKISPKDFAQLNQSLHYGWMVQQIAAYKNKSNYKQAVISAAEMCRNKQILRRSR